MVGEVLKREREKQNLSIDDVEKGTSIRATYIDYIEKGIYDELPGEVYTKGFIRNYAKFLKLDPAQLIAQYNDEQGVAPAVIEVVQPQKSKRRVSLLEVGKDISSTGINEDSAGAVPWGKMLKITAMLLVAGGIIAGGITLLSTINDKSAVTTITRDNTPQGNETNANNANQENKPGNAVATANAPVNEVAVSVKLKDRCWLWVEVDGKTAYEGILTTGATEKWQGKDSVVLHMGNAGAVELTVNGKTFDKVGGVGEVLVLSLDKTSHTKPLAVPANDVRTNTPGKATVAGTATGDTLAPGTGNTDNTGTGTNTGNKNNQNNEVTTRSSRQGNRN